MDDSIIAESDLRSMNNIQSNRSQNYVKIEQEREKLLVI